MRRVTNFSPFSLARSARASGTAVGARRSRVPRTFGDHGAYGRHVIRGGGQCRTLQCTGVHARHPSATPCARGRRDPPRDVALQDREALRGRQDGSFRAGGVPRGQRPISPPVHKELEPRRAGRHEDGRPAPPVQANCGEVPSEPATRTTSDTPRARSSASRAP